MIHTHQIFCSKAFNKIANINSLLENKTAEQVATRKGNLLQLLQNYTQQVPLRAWICK